MTDIIDQKQYSPILDEEYGQKAERMIVQFLESRPEIEQIKRFPFGKKDVDIQAIQHPSKPPYFIDVERRGNWVWPLLFFPFSTIHIPFRKKGMILNHQPFYYFAVRDDCKRFATIPGSIIMDSEILRSKNKYDNAKFYNVPVENLRYWELEV